MIFGWGVDTGVAIGVALADASGLARLLGEAVGVLARAFLGQVRQTPKINNANTAHSFRMGLNKKVLILYQNLNKISCFMAKKHDGFIKFKGFIGKRSPSKRERDVAANSPVIEGFDGLTPDEIARMLTEAIQSGSNLETQSGSDQQISGPSTERK